jgi:hypothetical protein
VTIVATSRNARRPQPVGLRGESPPIVISEPQAPPTHLPPEHPILFDQVRPASPVLGGPACW